MTYGELLERARAHLVDAAANLTATPVGDGVDVLALAAGRAAVYRHLERNVALLIRRTSRYARSRSRASLAQDRLFTRFRERLRLAADDLRTVPAITSETPAVRWVTAAADCLGAAADILATHLSPHALTPEGAAIREGGGLAAPALAQLAGVASCAVSLDTTLTAWLASSAETAQPLAVWAVGEARRGIGSLSDIVPQLLASASAEPAVINGLQFVPHVGSGTSPVETVVQSVSSLTQVRTWLWRNPDLVHAVHLRLGAELGLAVHVLARQQTYAVQPGERAWRRAATAAGDLDGTAPTDVGAMVASRLTDLLRWLRTTAGRDDVLDVGGLLAPLATLATALLAGTDSAVRRCDIFVNRTRLATTPSGGAVVSARTVWRPARLAEPEIIGLRTALADAADGRVAYGNSGAGAAFRRPLRTVAAPARPSAPVGTGPAPGRKARHHRA
jgi:hypothetical protein